MSDLFITQLDQEAPSVLVIGSPTFLRMALEKECATHFAVQTATVSEILRTQPATLPEFYKIIWVVESTTAFSASDKQLLSWLKTRTEPSVIIGSTLSFLTTTEQPWQSAQNHQAQWFEQLQQEASASTWIIGENLIHGQSLPESALLGLMLANFNQGQIRDPQLVLPWLNTASFVSEVRQHLFHPRPHPRLLLRGQQQATSGVAQTLQFLYRQYFDQELQIVPLAAQLHSAVGFLEIQVKAEKSVDAELENAVRSLPLINATQLHQQTQAAAAEQALKESLPTPSKQARPRPTPQSHHGEAKNIKIPIKSVPVVKTSVEQLSSPLPKTATQPKPQPEEKTQTHQLSVTKHNHPERVASTESQLDQAVSQLFTVNRSEYKVERVKDIAKNTLKITHKSKKKTAIFYGGIGVFGAVLAMGVLGVVFWASFSRTQAALIASLARQDANSIQAPQTGWAGQWLATQTQAYGALFTHQYLDQAQLVSTVAQKVTTSATLYSAWQQDMQNLVLSILGAREQEVASLHTQSQQQTQALYDHLSQLQAELKELESVTTSSSDEDVIKNYQAQLLQNRRNLASFQQLSPHLLEWLGYQQQKTYAVLLQNNQELRPTGGFIQAVALMTFDKGTLINTQVFDIYELDQKLGGSIKPPDEIKQFLGEQQWFVRDSNWNPDFPTTAAQVAHFIERATGKKADGVIGINLYSLQTLIKALGPVELPEYNEVITDRNLFERMEFHSEIQLTPDPTRQEYSEVLLNRVLVRLTTLPPEKVGPVLAAFNQSLGEHQALLSMSDPTQNETLNTLGWTGSVLSPLCPTQFSGVPCVVDSVYQVEANVGVNKANYHLERSIAHTVTLEPTTARHVRTIVYKNTSSSNAWPKGPYKTYTRFYLPTDTQVQAVSVNGTPLSPDQLIVGTEQDKKSIGFLTETPIQQETKIEVIYTKPLLAENAFAYTFLDQKQPGTSGDTKTITFALSPGLQPMVIAPQAQVQNNQILFKGDFNNHAFVGVEIKKSR
ncbi:MAG TPA: DUF4012 domain-containing protein [Vitreimonas sp.]|nr:DUF4012 domain-containing protein [Vitreimonas sp.]